MDSGHADKSHYQVDGENVVINKTAPLYNETRTDSAARHRRSDDKSESPMKRATQQRLTAMMKDYQRLAAQSEVDRYLETSRDLKDLLSKISVEEIFN